MGCRFLLELAQLPQLWVSRNAIRHGLSPLDLHRHCQPLQFLSSYRGKINLLSTNLVLLRLICNRRPKRMCKSHVQRLLAKVRNLLVLQCLGSLCQYHFISHRFLCGLVAQPADSVSCLTANSLQMPIPIPLPIGST